MRETVPPSTAACNYESFFQLSSDIMVVLDPELRLLKCNPAFRRMSGLTGSGDEHCSLLQFIHPDDRACCWKRWNEAAENHSSFTIRERMLTVSGPVAQIQWHVELSADRTQIFAAGTLIPSFDAFSDNQWHRSFLDQALDCFGTYSAIRDETGRIVDFRIDYINQSAAAQMGLAQDAQIGKRLRLLFPRITEKVMDMYRQVVETGSVSVIEGYPYADDRMTAILDVLHFKFGDGFAVSWRDVSPRKMAEARLEASNKKFSSAFHNAPTINFILDAAHGRIIEANQHFQAIKQLTAEELILRPIAELDLWVNPADFNEFMSAIVASGPIRNHPISYLGFEGEARIGLLSGEQIAVEDEECILFIMNDVTELKDAENRLTLMDKYQLLGSMAASIAHEVRNPMTTVKGFIQLFQQQKDLQGYHSRLKLIASELERANSIITEYLSLASNRPTEKVRHHLHEIVRYLLPLLEADALEHAITMDVSLDEVTPLLLNENEIRQLLLNLFRNAVEAMPRGGKLSILTYMDDGQAVLEVRDEGTGIEQQALKSIFNPFFTTKAHGTGLGLAVCRSIALRHSAVISAHAQPVGTSFKVAFDCTPKLAAVVCLS